MAHISASQAYSQVNHPPVTIGILHQIPMSYAMDAGGLHMDIGKDGIVEDRIQGAPGDLLRAMVSIWVNWVPPSAIMR